MIQSQNNSFKKLEALMSQLNNAYGVRKLFLINIWSILIALVVLMSAKNYGVLETLTKIQFHHNILNLTNPNPLTNWQVFHSIRLNLNVNVNLIPNFVIQYL